MYMVQSARSLRGGLGVHILIVSKPTKDNLRTESRGWNIAHLFFGHSGTMYPKVVSTLRFGL